ncbi:hypothetical protein EDD70_2214 [Hydrogenoanaerobacterium saccharovorans]|uniref:Uncharacterized protein n=1 Tax=Hydrogenoanaerobacterium saccharovorans TaxID=474960 RepID=A0A1H8CPA7_9FIRM|nr:hypothetical protein [Hydrogenoanaerobacterium saccharovorans]RPF43251.1 hypothetical protein EDD70_2214 [Hydrogenoanaerobacterium saccharovorans]SEM97091.1 hypothetical protein SAMN05216180_2272 [Hydrogenoanaerobacterium saccharovorans]
MPDYQKMYHVLFNQITNTIEDLQRVQQQTEELYVCAQELAPSLPTEQDVR